MSGDTGTGESAGSSDPGGAPVASEEERGGRPSWRARARKWAIIGAVGAVVIPALAITLWTWVALSWSYSNGQRAGYVQKISKKGWLCPTWEGELQMVNLPGAAPERWTFSVREDLVAAAIQNSIGKRVALEYEEHRGVPTSCFGETDYFIVGVRIVE